MGPREIGVFYLLVVLCADMLRGQLLPMVDAFSVPEGFHHLIKSPENMPFEMGVTLIHSPETFLLLQPAPAMLSLFRFEESEWPQQIPNTNYVYVAFTCTGRFARHHRVRLHGRMLTDKRTESHLVIGLDNKTPLCTATLSVSRPPKGGFHLLVEGQLYATANEAENAATVVAMWRQHMMLVLLGLYFKSVAFVLLSEKHVAIGDTAGTDSPAGGISNVHDDANMREYRRLAIFCPKKN